MEAGVYGEDFEILDEIEIGMTIDELITTVYPDQDDGEDIVENFTMKLETVASVLGFVDNIIGFMYDPEFYFYHNTLEGMGFYVYDVYPGYDFQERNTYEKNRSVYNALKEFMSPIYGEGIEFIEKTSDETEEIRTISTWAINDFDKIDKYSIIYWTVGNNIIYLLLTLDENGLSQITLMYGSYFFHTGYKELYYGEIGNTYKDYKRTYKSYDARYGTSDLLLKEEVNKNYERKNKNYDAHYGGSDLLLKEEVNYFLNNYNEIGEYFTLMASSENDTNRNFSKRYFEIVAIFTHSAELKKTNQEELNRLQNILNEFYNFDIPTDFNHYFSTINYNFQTFFKIRVIARLFSLELEKIDYYNDLNYMANAYNFEHREYIENQKQIIEDINKIKTLFNKEDVELVTQSMVDYFGLRYYSE
jgi:hypothetical protein